MRTAKNGMLKSVAMILAASAVLAGCAAGTTARGQFSVTGNGHYSGSVYGNGSYNGQDHRGGDNGHHYGNPQGH